MASSSDIAWSYFELLNAGRIEEAFAVLDDSGTQWGLNTKQTVPLSALKGAVRRLWQKAPMHFTRQNAFDAGDHAILELESHATRPDGEPYHNWYCFVITIANGKIVHMREYADIRLGKELLDSVGGWMSS
jgi:ketosteroid isomerase-like protein